MCAIWMAKRWRSATDDSEQVIGERLDAYERQTRPVLEYYRTTPVAMFEVDAQPGAAGARIRKRFAGRWKTDDRA